MTLQPDPDPAAALTICLPHPDRVLHPNASNPTNPAAMRCIMGRKFAEKKKARTLARMTTLEALNRYEKPPFVEAYGLIWYYNGKRPDCDGCIAICKAYLDGICEALQIDDNGLDIAYAIRMRSSRFANLLTINFYDQLRAGRAAQQHIELPI